MTSHAPDPGRRTWGPFAAAVTVAAAAGVAWFIDHATPARRQAIVLAAAVCVGGNLTSWLVGRQAATTPSGRVTASLAAIGLRLFPALAALGWLQSSGAELRAAGGGELLLVFYLAAVAADLIWIIMGAVRGGGGRRAGKVI